MQSPQGAEVSGAWLGVGLGEVCVQVTDAALSCHPSYKTGLHITQKEHTDVHCPCCVWKNTGLPQTLGFLNVLQMYTKQEPG